MAIQSRVTYRSRAFEPDGALHLGARSCVTESALVRCGMPHLARFAYKARFPSTVVGTRGELAAACHDYDYDYEYLLDCLCGTERPALTWLDL